MGIFAWQVAPPCANTENPENAFETAAIRCPRSAPSIFPSLRCREQILNLLPLLVGQHHDNS